MRSPRLCTLGTAGGQTVPPGVGTTSGAEVVKAVGPQLWAPALGGLLPRAGQVAGPFLPQSNCRDSPDPSQGSGASLCVCGGGGWRPSGSQCVPRWLTGNTVPFHGSESRARPCPVLPSPGVRPILSVAEWTFTYFLGVEQMCFNAPENSQQKPLSALPFPTPGDESEPLALSSVAPPLPSRFHLRLCLHVGSSAGSVFSGTNSPSATSNPQFNPLTGVSLSMIVSLLPEVLWDRFSD